MSSAPVPPRASGSTGDVLTVAEALPSVVASSGTLSPAAPTAGFARYEDLARAHRERLGQCRAMDDAAVDAFVSAVRGTGARLADPDERARAQGILDFWVAELIGRGGVDMRAWVSEPLAPFDESETPAAIAPPPEPPAGAASQDAPSAARASREAVRWPLPPLVNGALAVSSVPGWLGTVLGVAGGILQDARANPSAAADDAAATPTSAARERIRLAAVARQWRGTGAEGYLLNGRALADAERFADDPDIGALVRASRRAVERRDRLRRWLVGTAGAALVGAVVVLIVQNRAKDVALEQRDRALTDLEAQKSLAERRGSLAETNAAAEAAARQAAESARASALDRLRQLESRQVQLDAAIALIRRERAAGRLDAAAVPPSLVPLVEAGPKPSSAGLPHSESRLLSGYRADFLGTTVPIPAAAASGPVLPYANFTVVLDAARRVGRIAAVNIDRQGLRVLPDAGARALVTDPRVPAAQQPDPAWFDGAGRVAIGRLVSGAEIAWGPVAEGQADMAASHVTGMVEALPNAAVQLAPFRNGPWSGLTGWLLTRFAPDSTRVTVFGGPVLRGDDPRVDGVAVPRAYWKVVAGRDLDGTLVVDAFLLPQFVDGSDAPVQGGAFDPDRYRAPVARLEAATGLDFGDEIRAAGPKDTPRAAPATDAGDRLVAKIGQIDATTKGQRTAVTQELVSALRDGALPAPDQRVVAASLVSMAGDDVMPRLARNGRYNLLFALSEIPAALWNRPDWLDLKAQARHAVAALEARVQAGTLDLGPDMREFLDTLKARLDWRAAQGITVYLQFAGMTREAAVAVGQGLRSLGWAVPGEERTSAAARRNEIRYGDPADADAARLLAADLRAEGLAQVTAVKRHPGIKTHILEIWISQ